MYNEEGSIDENSVIYAWGKDSSGKDFTLTNRKEVLLATHIC